MAYLLRNDKGQIVGRASTKVAAHRRSRSASRLGSSVNRAIQSVGDPEPETKSYYAAMIDETKNVNKDALVKGTPFKVSQIDKVYEVIVFTLDERVHIASLTPSTYYEPIYYIVKGKNYYPEDEEEREKWHEMEDELLRDAGDGSYIDYSYAEKIARRDRSRVRRIGDFESFDDAREYVQGNYPF